jgi:hypothetical protein
MYHQIMYSASQIFSFQWLYSGTDQCTKLHAVTSPGDLSSHSQPPETWISTLSVLSFTKLRVSYLRSADSFKWGRSKLLVSLLVDYFSMLSAGQTTHHWMVNNELKGLQRK